MDIGQEDSLWPTASESRGVSGRATLLPRRVRLALNLLGLVASVRAPVGQLPFWSNDLVIQLAFYGFLIPISIAMSARIFPISFRTPLPRTRMLTAGLVLEVLGMTLHLYAELLARIEIGGIGMLLEATGLALFILGLGIFARRRPLPRKPVRLFLDPFGLHGITAYIWLLLTAVLLVLEGLSSLGLRLEVVPEDMEVHMLGAGFVTLLILGVGAYLLPGFANRPLRSVSLVWVTLLLGNLSTFLRVAPILIANVLPATSQGSLLALAGAVGLLAIAAFGVNLTSGRNRAGTGSTRDSRPITHHA